jgi:hypothetical protein
MWRHQNKGQRIDLEARKQDETQIEGIEEVDNIMLDTIDDTDIFKHRIA